jgi:acetoin utilization deacetylase AcuC-like enzyme
MKTIYSPTHVGHSTKPQNAVELPERVENVRVEIETRNLGPVLAPDSFGDEAVLRVHPPGLVAAFRDAPEGSGFDPDTPIFKGTFAAARAAVDVALTGAGAILSGERAAFALTRPPGHHAGAINPMGFCYLNNIAIAAEELHANGMRVAILDVDYHHGNGTQELFASRDDVLFVSLHGDPSQSYPGTGFAGETGIGAGEGFTRNFPLPNGTGWDVYAPTLDAALRVIEDFGPDAVLVSLGLDTFAADPIAGFRLRETDYLRMGEAIARTGRSTLFVFEGGYNLSALGEITANVLEGFEESLASA